MNDDELAFASVVELGALLRAGTISSVELARVSLRRLDTVGRDLRAVVFLTEERALAEAKRADDELRRGTDRGPLHGIPYGLKDVIALSGAPTTWGAEPFRDQTLPLDATVAVRLREAGAVHVAKLATVELAGGMGYDHPNASWTGATANPWDVSSWAGGSSTGPSSAVAAGLVPFAVGSDTSGSILLPAAWTGVAGLRATYGLVSRYGAMTLCWTLDRLGPLCRSAADCALVLEAIAGHDPQDPSSLDVTYRAAAARTSGFRIGVVAGAADGAEPDIAARYSDALDALGTIADLEEIELPDLPYGPTQEIISAAEAYAAFDDFIAAGGTAGLTATKARVHRLAGATLPAHDYIRAQRVRRQIAATIDGLFGRFDAVVAPTIGKFGSGVDEQFQYMLPGAFPKPVNYAGVLTGSPSITIPSGSSTAGLPTSIQFAGARLGEAGILDAASALEKLLGVPHLGAGRSNQPPSTRQTKGE